MAAGRSNRVQLVIRALEPCQRLPHKVGMAKGLYRDGDWAQVSYTGRASIPVRREQYEADGHQPPFAELRTKKEYEAQQAAPLRPDPASMTRAD